MCQNRGAFKMVGFVWCPFKTDLKRVPSKSTCHTPLQINTEPKRAHCFLCSMLICRGVYSLVYPYEAVAGLCLHSGSHAHLGGEFSKSPCSLWSKMCHGRRVNSFGFGQRRPSGIPPLWRQIQQGSPPNKPPMRTMNDK